jgi:hypothetical protein
MSTMRAGRMKKSFSSSVSCKTSDLNESLLVILAFLEDDADIAHSPIGNRGDNERHCDDNEKNETTGLLYPRHKGSFWIDSEVTIFWVVTHATVVWNRRTYAVMTM